MSRVKVSSKYQIVIPREMRDAMRIHKGQYVSLVPIGGVIEIVPDESLETMEGAFPNITLENYRDEADRVDEGRL
jgi:AbrB family looped-hinge helix DNA binding protein